METTPQDNRQRALDALQRRFAVAKAEVLQQQRKTKPGSSNHEPASQSTSNLEHQPASKFTLSSTIQQNKDVEETDPYAVLSQCIHENLMPPTVEISHKKGTRIDKFMHELLQKGDSAQKYMQGSRSMKLDSVILLDNFVKGHGRLAGSRIRALLNHSKRSKKRMSMRQHKKSGSLDLPRDLQRFEKFIPMHEIWKGYITKLLKISGNHLAQSLLNADLHGAIIQVVEHKVTSYNGTSGIMIRETAETLGIITRDDKFCVVPKKGCVFMLQADSWKITLHGDKLIGRDLGL